MMLTSFILDFSTNRKSGGGSFLYVALNDIILVAPWNVCYTNIPLKLAI